VRIAVGVEYKGTHFCGWQAQKGVRTVQECLEGALGCVADQSVRVVTAGRTDTGVHASGQVVHFDTDRERSDYSWLRGANSNLPRDVRVTWVRHVNDDFHARFKAEERSYRYVIQVSSSPPAILNGLCAWVHYELNAALMQEGVSRLLGRHDFSAFRAAGCQARTPVRTVRGATVQQSGAWFWLDIMADAFLQHMVRNIVGSLILVGRGERRPEWMAELLHGKDRTRAGAAAPPEGLYLTGVRYAGEHGIPGPVEPPRFW